MRGKLTNSHKSSVFLLSFNTKMIGLLGEMIKLLQAEERKTYEPEPEPERFIPERPQENESWLQERQRKNS